MKRNREVRRLAEKLLYDLTQLPGESSDDERLLGRALTRFLTSPHLSADALIDDLDIHTPYQVEEKK
jgi:hypothetical protein